MLCWPVIVYISTVRPFDCLGLQRIDKLCDRERGWMIQTDRHEEKLNHKE